MRMPRTVESIVQCHEAAQELRRAGHSIWTYEVDVSGPWRDEMLTFEERRNAIIAILRKHPWINQDNWHGWDLQDLVEELTTADTEDDFNEIWDALYDEADYDRVWINT
jgi:hypothetical protein